VRRLPPQPGDAWSADRVLAPRCRRCLGRTRALRRADRARGRVDTTWTACSGGRTVRVATGRARRTRDGAVDQQGQRTARLNHAAAGVDV